MTDPAITIRGLSKRYKLGTIGRHTLADECQYLWHKIRGRDPRAHMAKIGRLKGQPRPGAEAEDGWFWALRDATFDVAAGEVVGIIGRNGAGKSTLLKLLTRITEPTEGEAEIQGRVASLLEVGTGFHPELTGRENIFMNGTILGMKMKEIQAKFDEIVAFAEIEPFIDTPVKRYSSGMYVRLAFAVAAHLESEILLIDEVLAVGDAEFQKKCLGKMGEVARAGRTVFFVSHNMPAIQNLCGRAVVIHHGRVVLDDEPEKAIAHYIEACGASRGVELQRDPATISASAAAAVVSARLENGSGELAGHIPMGDGFTLRIRVVARQPVESFMAAVAITDAMGTRLCGLNSRDGSGEAFSLRAGAQMDIVCRLPQLNLLPGVYALNLGLQRTVSREPMDYFAGALSFEVLPRDVFGTGKIPHGPGHMYLFSEWMAEG
jgi:lipopolysaccharide transport system ATP-binding protein